ncbi:hypothetical protein K7432_009320 [Basidiobolus ranarum]|uniref:AB hydrolase-1 domain-containing protein n=1 Tax=Basidiobolus ranarum TaxID=34480 RepID=A0ABR2WQF0_9FUNG
MEASDTADYHCVPPDYHPSNNQIYKSFNHYSANIVNNGTNVKIHYVREGPKNELAKAGYQVIAFDTRGQGESSIPDDGYDGLTVATDLHLVLQSLNITRDVHVVAHDIGVWIGFGYVQEFASEVASFTTSGAPIPNEIYGEFPAYPRPGKFKWWFASLQSEARPFPEELVICKERLYFGRAFDDLMLPETRSGINEKDFDEYIRVLSRRNVFRAGNAYYRNLWNTIDIYKSKGYYQKRLAIPVLTVIDTLIGELIATTTKDYASNITMQNYHGGHFIWEEAPKDTTRGLINFLSHI